MRPAVDRARRGRAHRPVAARRDRGRRPPAPCSTRARVGQAAPSRAGLEASRAATRPAASTSPISRLCRSATTRDAQPDGEPLDADVEGRRAGGSSPTIVFDRGERGEDRRARPAAGTAGPGRQPIEARREQRDRSERVRRETHEQRERDEDGAHRRPRRPVVVRGRGPRRPWRAGVPAGSSARAAPLREERHGILVVVAGSGPKASWPSRWCSSAPGRTAIPTSGPMSPPAMIPADGIPGERRRRPPMTAAGDGRDELPPTRDEARRRGRPSPPGR